jgi:hypothetical protein
MADIPFDKKIFEYRHDGAYESIRGIGQWKRKMARVFLIRSGNFSPQKVWLSIVPIAVRAVSQKLKSAMKKLVVKWGEYDSIIN